MGRWTPGGWVINLGAAWGAGLGVDGRTDADFVLETQVRKHPAEHLRALRAQWVADALGEPKHDGRKEGGGGLWSALAVFAKKAIVADAEPAPPGALGTELGGASESAETRAMAVEKSAFTDAHEQVALGADGVITIPAAACSGNVSRMKSFLVGLQAFCADAFRCEVNTPAAGTYRLTARVVTVHDEGQVQLTVNQASAPMAMVIPYTCGRWEQTRPVEVALVAGRNVLDLGKPERGFTLKDITLTPVK